MQEQERNKQKEMEHWIKHIKKTFKGDERFMMLSTYYREVGYSQLSSIKSSLSLLLQIPFFIAAGLLLTGIAFIVIGVTRGEALTVFQKAIRICLECIGIG